MKKRVGVPKALHIGVPPKSDAIFSRLPGALRGRESQSGYL
ncbi:hypothetical protein NNO_1362 [Hydrogenimonas sp.]|nr:hypothetical protein NNO_1362 [Hydrogenimonas sp.]